VGEYAHPTWLRPARIRMRVTAIPLVAVRISLRGVGNPPSPAGAPSYCTPRGRNDLHAAPARQRRHVIPRPPAPRNVILRRAPE
jgi:hypothetical protein